MSVQNGERLATKQDLADMYSGILPYLGGMPEVLANKFSKGDIYSTSEKMIGQWIDGKPLYQITYTGLSLSVQSNKWTNTGLTKPTNADKIVCAFGGNQTASVGYIACSIDGNGIQILQTRNNDMSFDTLTIRYTKSSDSAISIGDETDYSTTEKIVGTWLNGEPLYQCTYEITSPSSANAQVVVTNLSYIQNCVKIDGLLSGALPINWVFESGRRITTWFDTTSKQVYMDCTSATERNLSGTITLQYTKSNS